MLPFQLDTIHWARQWLECVLLQESLDLRPTTHFVSLWPLGCSRKVLMNSRLWQGLVTGALMVYVVTNEYERANGIDQQCYAGRQFREEAKPESTTEDANKYVKPPNLRQNFACYTRSS